MEVALAIVIGALYAAGLYMMLRRSMVKLIAGLVLLGYASNLLIFVVSRLTRARPPLVPEGAQGIAEPFADPVPQALILTAIVIGFGLQAFALVLVRRAYQAVNNDDLDQVTASDRPDLQR
ncbi:MAG: Na+/H+ antiporter subunit C [Anaerolineaceae bacterium]|nr:Na+/H+ antiporter subunit C [Anaerolineaceae bacterium]